MNGVTKERIEEALRKSYNDSDLIVLECNLSAATQAGDNFLSYMTRAACKIRRNQEEYTENLIIKTLPTNGPLMMKMVTELECFKVEAHLLGNVLPEIHELLSLAGINSSLAAKLYYSEFSDNTLLIMEDLSIDGFKVGDRCNGLNEEQCQQVMRSLATYHVASKVVLRRNPELHNGLSVGYWGAGNAKNTGQFFTEGLDVIIDTIDSWSDEKWSEQLKAYKSSIPNAIHEAFDCEKSKVPHVLMHGDTWTNNIMFKSLGDDKYDLRFVDFQLSAIRSPMVDVIYFIFNSPSNDIRFKIMDSLLETYHKQWCHISALLGEYTDITIDDLKDEFRRVLAFGFGVMYSVYPVISLPKEEAIDTTKEPDGVEDRVFKRESTQKAILAGLKFFKEQGLFS